MAKKELSLEFIAAACQAKLVGEASKLIEGVADLQSATDKQISFLANSRYNTLLKSTQAGAVLVQEHNPEVKINQLIVHDPSLAFQAVLELFINNEELMPSYRGNIHETAVVHHTAMIADGVTIGPYCIIEKDVIIDSGTVLEGQVYVAPGVQIGRDCHIYSHVTLREATVIKNRVIIQPGAVIGSCGYGYSSNHEGHSKLKQLGNVVLHDDVEIGANTAIDRARFASTVIGQGTKIDNLVQIGHNVALGKHNLIVSQTGIAGSTKTGHFVVMGGQTGVVGHVEIASGVQIASRGGVSKSITKPGAYGGSPVMPLTDYNRYKVQSRKLKDVFANLKQLEEKVATNSSAIAETTQKSP